MISISSRDIVADLPPSILKKRIKEIEERNNIIPIKFSDYTPETVDKIKQLCESGKRESYPVINYNTESINWENKDRKPHREDGPARIMFTGSNYAGTIEWVLNGIFIARQSVDNSDQNLGVLTGSTFDFNSKQYPTKIKNHFPKADKIWIWEWMTGFNPYRQDKIDDFRKKAGL